MKDSVVAAFLIGFFVTSSGAIGAELEVQVAGFSSDAGQARILLFREQAGYRGDIEAERIALVPIRNSRADWFAEDLPEGFYSIIAHHDSDANGELDRAFFNLPLEPYGYSNGVWTSFGLPAWDAVAFEIGISPARQVVHIRLNAFAALGQMVLVGAPFLVAIFGGLALFRRSRAQPA
jgi:uncharacterized protein (DUF2141 family)